MMLDLERIRNDPNELRRMLASRFMDPQAADSLLQQDTLRQKLARESQDKKKQRNEMSRKIGELKQNGVYGEEVAVIINQMHVLGPEIAVTDEDIAELDDKINAFLLSAPNYPHASVPVGMSDRDDEEVYHSGGCRSFTFDPKPYWNIGSELKILDFDDTEKLKSTRFAAYRDLGARLERSVTNFILDTHIRSGYRELAIPYLVMSDEKTGDLPKPVLDESGNRKVGSLQPGSDRSIVSLYHDRLLAGDELPIRHCAFSAGTRSDMVGGRLQNRPTDTVELLTICRPEDSYTELSAMTEQARNVLALLGLPCRVMLRCTGQMPLNAAKTYGLEVWMPGSGRYVEVSACSNCEAFETRRLDIRFRETDTGPPRLCHTLSGSGIAVGRTVAAILENHQNADGSVTVPEVLQQAMHTDIIR